MKELSKKSLVALIFGVLAFVFVIVGAIVLATGGKETIKVKTNESYFLPNGKTECTLNVTELGAYDVYLYDVGQADKEFSKYVTKATVYDEDGKDVGMVTQMNKKVILKKGEYKIVIQVKKAPSDRTVRLLIEQAK